MIKRKLNELRAGPCSLVKKLFIGYLALVTGCTTPLQQVEQGAALTNEREQAVSNYSNSNSRYAVPGERTAEPSSSNPYGLPELGGAANTSRPDESSSVLDDLSGGLVDPAQQNIANPLAKGFDGPDALQGMAVGMLTSAATEGVKNWFSAKNATAEMSMSAGERGTFTGSFDLLMPVFDNKTDLVFAQVGYRRSNALTEDYRNTVNIGVGYRRNLDNWLAGVNAFYDRDMTGKNGRFSIGAEAFTDNFKASANVYIRATDWHESPDLDDYMERPANGYDLRIDANLPAYPQLGGKLVYEQYFGDEVGLFGSSNRQKDPQAVTVGLTYNPVPMIGVGVDYRQGQGGVSETSAKLSVNYQFGVPLSKQLSLAYSKSHRLENTRFDLVDRRYDVILDYKEKESGQVMLPALVSGTPTQTISFPITVTDGTIGSFTWTGTAAQFALPYGGGPTASVVLPAYDAGGNNLYTLQAVGTDRFGRVIKSNFMQVRVDAFVIALNRSAASAKADGNDEVMFTALLQEPTGAARQNTSVVWDVQGTADVVSQDEKTDSQGKARLTVTSRFSSSVRVTVQEPQGAKAESDAAFSGDQRSARVLNLTATPSTLAADGKSSSKLVATIVDSNGNAVGAGAPVTWSTTAGDLSSNSTVTDANSTATVDLISGVSIGTATVTAAAVAGSANTPVVFVADNATARVLSLIATPAAIAADGVASSDLVAAIVDANGNPVGAGIAVSWSSTEGALSTSASVTDAASKATVKLTSPTVVGSGTVTARTAAGAADASVEFFANGSTAKVVSLTATPATIAANGVDTSDLVAVIEDAHGNPVPGATVTWSSTGATLSSSSTVTDTQGQAHVALSGTAAGAVKVTAAAAAGAGDTTVTLVADASTARVVSLIATPTSIVANGADTSDLVAVIEDAHGNPVSGSAVTWSTSMGALSASTSITDAQGKAQVTLTSGTGTGAAKVTASAVAGAAEATVNIVGSSATARVVSLTASPLTIIANGSAASELLAVIEDAHGNPVAGAPVTWSTSIGSLSSTSTTTDAQGRASVALTGTAAGEAVVSASAVAGAADVTINLVADSSTARVMSLTAMPSTIVANGVDISNLVAVIEDAHGNPVDGAQVTWSTSSGVLSNTSAISDSQGHAKVSLSGTAAGQAKVTAATVAGAADATVILIADNSTARVMSLTATPATIAANGTDQSELVAVVEDANGNLVNGAAVVWETSTGTLTASETNTDATGKAKVFLSGTEVGTATVTAKTTVSASAVSATVTISDPTPVITSASATEGLSGDYFNEVYPPRASWSGTNLSNATTYEITVNLQSSCYFSGLATSVKTVVFKPSAGARSWYLDTRQDGKGTGTYAPQASNCYKNAVLKACNGSSCSSKSFPVPNSVESQGGA